MTTPRRKRDGAVGDVRVFTSRPQPPTSSSPSAWSATTGESSKKLRVLWSMLVLLLPAVAATNPRVLLDPPTVIAATNTSLTLEADVHCPPNCNMSNLTWEVTSNWLKDTMRTRTFENENTTFFISGLNPGKRYDIRALLQLKGENTTYNGKDVPVISTYTCSENISVVENLTVVESGTSHFIIRWAPGNESCASEEYFICGAPSEFFPFPDGHQCPPWDVDQNPQYSCKRTRHGRECTARIDDVEPGTTYTFWVVAAWKSHCSLGQPVNAFSQRKHPLGISVGSLATLASVLILSVGATCCIVVTLRKRRAARAEREALEGRMRFSTRPPNTTHGRMRDRDGNLLVDAEVELLSYEKL